MGHEEQNKAVIDQPACTHGNDDAVHAELDAWAMEWAKKCHTRAEPEEKVGLMEHIRQELAPLRAGEPLHDFPERLKGCWLAPLRHIRHALQDLHSDMPKHETFGKDGQDETP